MKKAISLLVLTFLLVFVGVAAATNTYGPTHVWAAGEDAQSSYGHWFTNDFVTYTSADTTVTFIDNNGYHWHDTKRVISTDNHIYYSGDYNLLHAAYCKMHWSNRSGSCFTT